MASREPTAGWAEQAGTVSRLRGRAFEAVCLASTSLALVSVLVLLLFVAKDAFQPLSADPGWHLVYFLTLVVPTVGLAVYYYLLDEPAGEVAYATMGIPIVGVLLSAGILVMFIEIVTVTELFALAVAIAASVGAIYAHRAARPKAPLERLFVIVFAPVIAIGGLPPRVVVTLGNWIGEQFDLGRLIPIRFMSLREAVIQAPYLPARWMVLLLIVTLPIALGVAAVLYRRRESRDDALVFVGLSLVGAALGLVAGPALGIGVDGWIIFFSFIVPPLGLYVEGVVRRREGIQGLVFPLVVIGGVLLGAVLVRQFGFAPPDPWLDWGFLTSPTSRWPEDAGIYPPIVGSVMMMIAIVVLIFPVGVGAAIYLEEYAPDEGLAGKVVTLIEINIGNLAGVPSVVYGLLGLALFIRIVTMPVGAVIVGALAIGLLILPIVIISAQEAIRAVPDSHREASYGMGATRWQTVRNVVLPQAFPGILTGTILALGRAIGETAPLLMIGMAASVRLAPDGYFAQGAAMPRQIFSWSTEFDPAFRHGVLAAGVVTLLIVLLIMNGTAIILRNKFQRQEA
ncbi:MAG: phosphate ABC transporter permease PstA [Halapricum sp.]